jgi:hypothetical protein
MKEEIVIEKYNKYSKIFNSKGYNLITTLNEFRELFKNNFLLDIIVKYSMKCRHEDEIVLRSIYMKKDTEFCKNCIAYKKCVDIFSNKECTCITTVEEYINNMKFYREKNPNRIFHSSCLNFTYIATCTHINTTRLHVFIDGHGLLCKKCISQNRSLKNEDGSAIHLRQEDDSIFYLCNLLKNNFITKLTDDGCRADLVIKDINATDDKWLKVQVKTTKKHSKYCYKFAIENLYIDCMIICFCIEDKKIWLFNGNEVGKSISISVNKNDSYIKSNEQLFKNINEYIQKFPLFSFDKVNIPVSLCQQKEQKFRKLRENKCNF